MRKLFLIFGFAICFLILKPHAVVAQQTSGVSEQQAGPLNDIFGNQTIPGVSCGDADNPNANKCCSQADFLDPNEMVIQNAITVLSKKNPSSQEINNAIKAIMAKKDEIGGNLPGDIGKKTADLLYLANLVDSLNKLQKGTLSAKEKKLAIAGGGAILSALIANREFEQKYPDFGCIFSVCVSDIPKGLFKAAIFEFTPFAKIVGVQSQIPVNPCVNGTPSTGDINSTQCRCNPIKNSSQVLCDRYLLGDNSNYKACSACSTDGGVWTGIGCLQMDTTKFIQTNVLGLGVGLAGVAAFICIIYSAFILQTSQGNPERIKKAREYLTNCIIGLLIIIGSIFLLRLVGVTILRIPGLS